MGGKGQGQSRKEKAWGGKAVKEVKKKTKVGDVETRSLAF